MFINSSRFDITTSYTIGLIPRIAVMIFQIRIILCTVFVFIFYRRVCSQPRNAEYIFIFGLMSLKLVLMASVNINAKTCVHHSLLYIKLYCVFFSHVN